jgi:putative thioredoxin
MTASDFIINVTESDFEYEVLAYSQQTPVVVDFWATWCGPCKTLGPMLERLAEEAQGNFRLAKVNVDENTNLAIRYGVRSIPAVKAFRNGEMVSEFIGLQPEPRLREFLRVLAPAKSDLILEKANSLLGLRQPKSAELAFREVLDDAPGSPAALLGLAKALLLQGRSNEAGLALLDFPASRELSKVELLRPLVETMNRLETGEGLSDNPLDAAFENAIRLIKRGNVEAALDGLLDILRQDKRYRNGLAREVFVAVLELMGEENPSTREYRNELAAVLF